MALIYLEHRSLVGIRCPRLIIIHLFVKVNLFVLIRSLVNPHRIAILNLTWPVQLGGLLARDGVDTALAVLGSG